MDILVKKMFLSSEEHVLTTGEKKFHQHAVTLEYTYMHLLD